MLKNKSTKTLILLNLFLALGSLIVGPIELPLKQLLNFDISTIEILTVSRLPRTIAVILSGTALAVAGLIMQNLCMNKFVSPSTGATLSSAQLGILIALLFLPHSNLIERALFSFIFAMLGTFLFVAFILKAQFKDIIMVPLVGIMFSYIISAITTFIAFNYELTQALSSFSVGHFSTILKGNYEIVYIVLPLLFIAFYYAQHFNIVGLGKNLTINLGISYNKILFSGLAIAAMLSASVVVIVGTISYVGLIVPNLIAIYNGDNLKHNLIDTALFGSGFLLACDLIARIVIFPYELPIDIIVSILGSIIFILLILRRFKSQSNFKFKKLWLFKRNLKQTT